MTVDPIVPELAEHTPLRPLWICRVDAHPWPCADVRLNLLAGYYPARRIELYLYLGAQFVTALAELDTIVVDAGERPDPQTLHSRILGWVAVQDAKRRRNRRSI
ncbi:hypothetical protein AB0J90_07410 [Micromonospora sp. NPDC049523]|uniref:hypothetical protein n=1 Tax=Micromonospora sp. NPDC049523 TaxID=3155921 RepID=UPI003429EB5F